MSQDCMEELIFILTLVAFFFNCGGEKPPSHLQNVSGQHG